MEHSIRFRDDDEAMQVLGVQDRHLRTLRELYGVQAVSRGLSLELSGDESAVIAARRVVESMVGAIRDGGPTPDLILADAESARPTPQEDDLPFEGEETPAEPPRGRRVPAGEDDGLNLKALARTPGQLPYLEALARSSIVLAIGPAGTGKTYLAVRMAVEALKRGDVRKLILCRPAVEAGEKLGFLPGDFQAKVNPYLRPLYDALGEILDYDQVRRYTEREIIEVAPLAYMRGRTLSKAWIILDEAQNTTTAQMKMFLTRMGQDSRIVVTGDITQIDLPRGVASGLVHARRILKNIKGLEWAELERRDIVRHPIVARIVEAYDRHESGGRDGESQSRGRGSRSSSQRSPGRG